MRLLEPETKVQFAIYPFFLLK